jgi:hypothetical protein
MVSAIFNCLLRAAKNSIKKEYCLVMKSPISRVVCSHGLGNQLFQLTFAHFINKHASGQVIFENNPFFSKGLNYMLGDMYKYCNHIRFRRNFIISHKSLFGRSIMKVKKVQFFSALIMWNFNINRIYSYDENNLFKFSSLDTNHFIKNKQYFGFFLNWQYVYAERNTVVPDILRLIEVKSKGYKFKTSKKKTLVIHVRRGDYLTRGNDEVLGVINPNSYKLLIKSIRNQEPSIEVLTITDDDFLATNINYGNEFGRILTRSEVDEWQAMQMMVDANYVIAANSTFSWWGATLSLLKNDSACFIPKNFYKKLEDKESFLFPGLNVYENTHL